MFDIDRVFYSCKSLSNFLFMNSCDKFHPYVDLGNCHSLCYYLFGNCEQKRYQTLYLLVNIDLLYNILIRGSKIN